MPIKDRMSHQAISNNATTRHVLRDGANFRLAKFRCPSASPLWHIDNIIDDTPTIAFPGSPVLIRHADAGYTRAIEVADERGVVVPHLRD